MTVVEENGSKLTFFNYIVEYADFKANTQCNDEKVKIDLKMDRDINIDDNDESTVYVSLILSVFDNAEENNYPFSFKMKITGKFGIAKDADEELRTHLIEKNAITILFPYARSLVTTFTSNCNVPPLILPPINVNKFF